MLLRASIGIAALLVLALGGPARGVEAERGRPSALRVAVIPQTRVLVLGLDREAAVQIDVTGTNGAEVKVTRTFTNVGTLSPVTPGSQPARFEARYTVPAERYPQVAMLVVEVVCDGYLARGFGEILLHATTEVPFRTTPGAAVTLRVADRTFGPVPSNRNGQVEVPVAVPPGVDSGLARATDPSGGVRETPVDLQPTPFPRVLIVAPGEVRVGSLAEVSVYAIKPSGEPLAHGSISLRSRDGVAHPLGSDMPGEARFLVEAPRVIAAGGLRLTAFAAGNPSARAELSVPLTPGPTERVVITPGSRLLVIGEPDATPVTVTAQDHFGNPARLEGVAVRVDGSPTPLTLVSESQGVIEIRAPQRYSGRSTIQIDAVLGALKASDAIRLTGGKPAKLAVELSTGRLVADGRRGAELRVRAFDQRGTPTSLQSLSWTTTGGRLGPVSAPREGLYVTAFTPERARHARREQITVSSDTLRATATLELEPPKNRIRVLPRFGFFSNLGRSFGPVGFIEVLRPLPSWRADLEAGIALGYLRNDVGTRGEDERAVRVETNQFPVLAVLRYRALGLPFADLSIGAGAGLSAAAVRVSSASSWGELAVESSARAPAFELSVDAAFPLAPGQVTVGVRYLWIDLGVTSKGDEVRGNSAGLVVDIGYRVGW